MSRISQPINQVRLTNVAIVRLKKNGKRFEVACYKNKVVNWRNQMETDIDEVLQIASVFTNVSKGILAKEKDLLQSFQTADQVEVCKIILEKGELQVSDRERQAASDRDIATIVAEKCVNPQSNRPYTVGMIERVMREVHFAPVNNRSAKQQALQVIKKLKECIPIDRAKMKLRISVPSKDGKTIQEKLESSEDIVCLQHDWNINYTVLCLVDPGAFRVLDDLVRSETKGAGTLDVIELSCQQEGDSSIDVLKEEKKEDMKVESQIPTIETTKKSNGLSCSTCGGDFGTCKQTYREHFKSDWHRFNLKRKSKGMSVIDETTFYSIADENRQLFFDEIS